MIGARLPRSRRGPRSGRPIDPPAQPSLSRTSVGPGRPWRDGLAPKPSTRICRHALLGPPSSVPGSTRPVVRFPSGVTSRRWALRREVPDATDRCALGSNCRSVLARDGGWSAKGTCDRGGLGGSYIVARTSVRPGALDGRANNRRLNPDTAEVKVPSTQ